MKLSESDVQELCRLACKAAIDAGRIIKEATINQRQVLTKKAQAPSLAAAVVTEIDFALHYAASRPKSAIFI